MMINGWIWSMWQFVCFSMNDNEGVAEMLIDSLGESIVNTADSKGR